LIQQYQEENIYILVSQESQEDMERFIKYNAIIISDKSISKKERGKFLFKIEALKNNLKKYQVNLRGKDIEAYNDTNIIIDCAYFKYVSYDMQKKYVYDEDIGFLTKPKKEISTTINI
jgi:CRISPR-associated endonuclease/helicase Cas3